jgi:TatD DNase family protein
LGIGGVSTFKKAGVKEVVAKIGLDRVVLETDSPYLAPVPKRGKRNEPAYTRISRKTFQPFWICL